MEPPRPQIPDPPAPPASTPPPAEGSVLSAVTAVKGLTLGNVLIIFLLILMGIPAYTIWRALGDDKLLDRFLSTYEEYTSQATGCVLRHHQTRGGPQQWGISSGFAFQGADRWFVSVVVNHEPSNDEIMTYCESLKLITDKMLADRSDDHGGGSGDGAAE